MNRVTPQDHLPELLNYALVAPRIKVLYVPTTKVACSSLKLLVSQVEGTYNAAAAEEIITPNISQEQTIHNYRVHGLTRFFEIPRKEQWSILTSPDWLRIAALRDPLRRAYSSFENRAASRTWHARGDLRALPRRARRRSDRRRRDVRQLRRAATR